jgi:hypothetical protein
MADVPPQDAAVATACAAAGRPPPLPERARPSESLQAVRGVAIDIEDESRCAKMDVSLVDVSNEQYALRVQEELDVGATGVKPANKMLLSLLDHAAHATALQDSTLHGERLGRDAALCLALDLAYKTAWRYEATEAGLHAKRSSFVKIFHTAALCELDTWRSLAARLSQLDDVRLMAELGGNLAEGGHNPPLLLFTLFAHQASKAAANAGSQAALDDAWLASDAATDDSMHARLLSSLHTNPYGAQCLFAGRPANTIQAGEVGRLGDLLRRAHYFATVQSAQQQQQQQQQQQHAAMVAPLATAAADDGGIAAMQT